MKSSAIWGTAILLVVLIALAGFIARDTSEITGKIVSEPPSSCIDSDGDSINSQGTTRLDYSDGSSESYVDYCEGSYTIEYSCSGTELVKNTRSSDDCECRDGACVKKSVCSETQCNPVNSEQICSNGQWTDCPAEQVCTLGSCQVPATLSSSGSSGDLSGFVSSGGGSSSGSSSSPPSSTNSNVQYNLGEISGAVIQEVADNEIISFTLNSVQYSLTASSISQASASLSTGSQQVSFSIAEEKSVNLDSDEQNELRIKLKSVNLATKKATFLITIL